MTTPAPRADLDGEIGVAWIDVETEGLNTLRGDRLFEIAILPSDNDLELLDTDGYHAVVSYTAAEVDQMRATMEAIPLQMHETSGLFDKMLSADAKPLDQVDYESAQYVKEFFPARRSARLGGNSVRLDLNAVEAWLPSLYDHLHYRMVDVTSADWFARRFIAGYEVKDKVLRHEAMADILESIDQARRIRDLLAR